MTSHPFDQALHLEERGSDLHHWAVPETYGNMVGPFGGIVLAAALKSVVCNKLAEGRPSGIALNFLAPIGPQPVAIATRLVRTNKTNQHWVLEMSQDSEMVCTASVMLATPRDVWSDQEAAMPKASAPTADSRVSFPGGPKWLSQYEFYFSKGPLTLSGQALENSESILWLRDATPRSLDYLSLAAMSDAFFPRSFVRKQAMGQAGTVTITTYFHANESALAAQGTELVLGNAQANRFHQGYFDQEAKLWGSQGELLATSVQLVYYR